MKPEFIQRLLQSKEAAIRYQVLARVLDGQTSPIELTRMREEIRTSPRIVAVLSEREADGTIPYHPYSKWVGAHWVLASLAELGYPPGDESLIPLREQVLAWLLGKDHQRTIRTIQGRVRRCASIESNALYSLLTLGLGDARTADLADRLARWQWPDGGWNCDKKPEAIHSSFMESLLPLRALASHARLTGSHDSREAAARAAEVFLKRRLYKKQSDGSIMHADFLALHYPCYWHYDILFGLKVMAEAGFIGDERCSDALNFLERKQLPDGGFPAEAKYYRVAQQGRSDRSTVDWGGVSKTRLNEFVTVDALYVLKAAGRLAWIGHGSADADCRYLQAELSRGNHCLPKPPD